MFYLFFRSIALQLQVQRTETLLKMESSVKERSKATKVFDDAQSKKTFLGLVKLNFKTSMFKEKRESIHLLRDIDVNKNKIQLINLEKKYKGRHIYEFEDKEGKNIVTMKRKGKNEPLLQVLSFEGIYDVLMELHIDYDHESNTFLQTATENKYSIPSICYDLIQEACNICREDSTRLTGASRTGIVSFIHHMKLRQTAYYNSVLIYIDEYTEFIIIRPTRSFDVVDMSTELFKIFMEFGPPGKVYMNIKESEFSLSIKTIMENVCPSCKIIFDYVDDELSMSFSVMDAIGNWMKEVKSTSWEIGCFEVQRRLNTKMKTMFPLSNMPVSAHDLFFKNISLFDIIHNSMWHQLEPVESTDEPLLYVKQNNMTDNEDPLATNVSNLKIQDERDKRRSSRTKIRSQFRNEDLTASYDQMDSTVAIEKPKSSKKKTKRKKITEKISNEKDVHDAVIHIMTADKVMPKQDSSTAVEEKTDDDETRKKILSKNNDKRQTDIKDSSTKSNNLTDTLDLSDIVKVTDIEATTKCATSTEIQEEDLEDDDDDVDFGAEI